MYGSGERGGKAMGLIGLHCVWRGPFFKPFLPFLPLLPVSEWNLGGLLCEERQVLKGFTLIYECV